MAVPTLRERSLEDQATDFLAQHGYVDTLKPSGQLAGTARDMDTMLHGNPREARRVARILGVRLH